MCKVLVVDDDEGIQFTLDMVLQSEGYETLLASDGQEALDFLLNQKISVDLILLDLSMPRMNGHDFLKVIKEQGSEALKKVPIVITSAVSHLAEREGLSQFSGFLQKPFQLEKLIETCNRFCQPA